MSNPSSPRSRRTRDALLAATRSLLEEEGLDALTMQAVAGRAGVTRRTVYLHFASRSDLVTALFEYIAGAEGLHESLGRVWAQPDAVNALAEWARHLARYHPRLIAVDRAFERVSGSDPDAAVHRAKVAAAQLESCRRLAAWLQQEGRLAASWTPEETADMLWALISTDMIDRLLSERGWSAAQLSERLAAMFQATFVEPSAPKRSNP